MSEQRRSAVVQKGEGKKPRAVYWDKDKCSKATCMCGKSSVEVLLDWLSSMDSDGRYYNYIRWKGGVKTKDAEKKSSVASSVVSVLKNEHNLYRNSEAVLSKMAEFISSYHAANDFLGHTGSGVLDSLDEQYADKNDHGYLAQLAPIRVCC